MMSAETIGLTTRTQTYDKTPEKKDEGTSSEKTPSTNPSPSTVPLTTEKIILGAILRPSKSAIWKAVFNPSA